MEQDHCIDLLQISEVKVMIPYNKLYSTGKEIEYVSDAIRRGCPGSDGYYTRLVETFIGNRLGTGRPYMTTSATHALEMAMLLIDLKPGDEVIMPSFTFSSTANAVLLRGARPVFAEIDENTLNIDASDMENRISSNTRAVIPVHYAGVSCEMDRIMDAAEKYGIFVVEDAAQAFDARYKGRYLGSIGHMGCYSFHSTKNLTCGEGGALLINTTDQRINERAEYIRYKGTDREKFLAGKVNSYSWVDIGSSYSPSDVLMAMLYAQLEQADVIAGKRKRIHEQYSSILRYFEGKSLLKLMRIPPGCEPNHHIFFVLFNDEKTRDFVKLKLYERGITALTHFVPLHSSKMGQSLGYCPGDLKKTEHAAECLLRLPIYTGMSDADLNFIGEQLLDILGGL